MVLEELWEEWGRQRVWSLQRSWGRSELEEGEQWFQTSAGIRITIGLVKTQIAGAFTQCFWFGYSVCDPRPCISNFAADADAADPRVALWGPHFEAHWVVASPKEYCFWRVLSAGKRGRGWEQRSCGNVTCPGSAGQARVVGFHFRGF